MRRLAGQAALRVARWLHRGARLLLALAVLGAVGLGALAWRLSLGPVELPWLTHRLEEGANAADARHHWAIGGAALAWEGFAGGVDRPLDIAVTDIAVGDAAGKRIATIPRAAVSLSLVRLLAGQVVPRGIAIDGAQLHAVRTPDGGIALDLDGGGAAGADATAISLVDILAELARPLQGDFDANESAWGQLQRILIRGASLSVQDAAPGLAWGASRLELDIRRARKGGGDGAAALDLAVGDQHVAMKLTAHLAEDRHVDLQANLTPFRPSVLAGLAPVLAPLAGFDAPLTLAGHIELSPALLPLSFGISAELGAGSVRVARGSVPVAGASLAANGTPSALTVTLRRLELPPHTVLTGQATLRREPGQTQVSASIDLDQLAFADLPALWPDGVGGKGLKPWLTGNITGGTAAQGHVALAMQIDEASGETTLTTLAGGIEAHDLTVNWLRPVPPLEHGEARLTFLSPDMLEIAVSTGRQAGGNPGVTVQAGTVRISGLAAKDQVLDLETDLAGTLPDLLAVLGNKRLHLLDRRPVDLRDPEGQFTGHLSLLHLPLEDRVTLDDLQLKAAAHLTGVHLGGVVAGRDLDQGILDFQGGNDGLKLQGSAQLAKIPAQLQVAMDFRSGGPAQVLQTLSATATADAALISAATGLDFGGFVSGPVGVDASMRTRRDGHDEITVRTELTQAALAVTALNFAKPAGQAATADVHLLLDHEQIAAIDVLRVQGEGMGVNGQIDFATGKPAVARLDRLVLGGATNLHGTVRWPTGPGGAWVIVAAGSSIDATAQLGRKKSKETKPPEEKRGPPWSIDATFDHVVAGPDRTLSKVVVKAQNDGLVTRQAQINGSTAPDGDFAFTILPHAGERTLTGQAADAGGLLRVLDVTPDMVGGHMRVSGRYDDAARQHPLAGTAEIDGFRMRKAPALAKLLQAMTLYGLVAVIEGPGLGFDHLVAPFRLSGDQLDLQDARAFNTSLGMTAKGRLDLAMGVCDVQGTIVPAYFFNSLLGSIPFVGKLFSPESGGGVLAASYTLRGDCDDPSVGVNPLAALTPGFLRGIFGLFDRNGTAAAPGAEHNGN